jgi:Heliorhodopsin
MAIATADQTYREAEGWPRLRSFNALMAAMHFAQALLILALSTDFSLPVNSSFVSFPEDASGPGDGMTEINRLFDLRIAPMIAAFLFVAAADHLLVSLPRANGWYLRNLDRGANWARWWEYAISASIMIVIIAMFTGVYDIATLILIASINAVMILCGLVMESVNKGAIKENVNWLPFWLGCFAGAMPWVIITLFLISPGTRSLDEVPDFVYGIFVSLFIFFNCFAVNMYLQYKRIGPWRNYIFGEYGFIVLSLVAKSALAWQVFNGTLT